MKSLWKRFLSVTKTKVAERLRRTQELSVREKTFLFSKGTEYHRTNEQTWAGGARRLTSCSRRAAFAALTLPPTDGLGSAAACGSTWSLADMARDEGRPQMELTLIQLSVAAAERLGRSFPTHGSDFESCGAVAMCNCVFKTSEWAAAT